MVRPLLFVTEKVRRCSRPHSAYSKVTRYRHHSLSIDFNLLRQQLLHDVRRHIGQAEVAALEAVGETKMVEAHQGFQEGISGRDTPPFCLTE